MSSEALIRSKWVADQMTGNNPETFARTLRDWYRRWVRARELRYELLAEILDDAETHLSGRRGRNAERPDNTIEEQKR